MNIRHHYVFGLNVTLGAQEGRGDFAPSSGSGNSPQPTTSGRVITCPVLQVGVGLWAGPISVTLSRSWGLPQIKNPYPHAI